MTKQPVVEHNEAAFLRKLADEPVFFISMLYKAAGLDKYGGFLPDGTMEPVFADMVQWAFLGPQKRVTLSRRSIGKSTGLVAGQIAWDLYRDNQHRAGIVSKSDGHAKNILGTVRQWLDNVDFLRHLTPRAGRKVRDSANEFDVAGSDRLITPSCYALGIEGQLTGKRAHKIHGDDLETGENTKTPNARDQLARSTLELENVATYGGKEVNIVGTFHAEDSLYKKLMKRGFKIRTYPMVYPADGDVLLNLAPILVQRLAEKPERHAERDEGGHYTRVGHPGNIVFEYHDDRDFVREKLATGATNFARQYALVANAGDVLAYPLQLSDLIVPDLDIKPEHGVTLVPKRVKWGRSDHAGQTTAWEESELESCGLLSGSASNRMHKPFMVSHPDEWVKMDAPRMRIDPAGRGRDQTGMAIVGHAAGTLWCVEAMGFGDEGEPGTDYIDHMVERARHWGVREIRIESNFGGEAFARMVESAVRDFRIARGEDPNRPDGWTCRVELMPAKAARKESRIIGNLSPAMSQHRLVVLPSCLRPRDGLATSYELQHQISAITEDPGSLSHDDVIEALGDAVADWLETVDLTPEQHLERLEARRRDAEFRELAKKYRVMNLDTAPCVIQRI